VSRREGDLLILQWEVGGLRFPMPLEVQVCAVRHRLPMTGGVGTVRVLPGETVEVDPDGWVLMHHRKEG